ncbi:MAG: hypothetical protein VKK80_17490, partial [Prochlorothrix sp.]|nr:hypothetical protein [Prochlorothrix sp.]
MPDISDISYPQLFIAYAQEHPEQWPTLVGQEVTHVSYGKGVITGIVERSDKYLIKVCFVNDHKSSKEFPSQFIASPQVFCDVQLPMNLEGIDQTKKRLQAQKAELARQKAIADQESVKRQMIIEQTKIQLRKEEEEFQQLVKEIESMGFTYSNQ